MTTDANGCFEAMLVTATQGGWEAVAEYPGDKCQGEVVVSDTTCHCR